MSLTRSLFARLTRRRFSRPLPPVRGRRAGLWRNRASGQGARRRRGRSHRLAGGESLERKQLLAVDIALQAPHAPGGSGGWITVVANQGSDVFMQVAATEPRTLLIADNASFRPRLAPVQVADFSDVYVYHGQVVDRSAFDPIYDPTDPLRTFGVPEGYPWLNGDAQDGDLFFVTQTEAIDWSEPVIGALDLNDGTPNDTIFFTNRDPATGNPTTTLFITNGPGTGSTLVYATGSTGGGRAPQLTFTFDNDQLFGATVGQTGMPVLALDYDADTERGPLPIRRVVSRDLGAAVGRPHTFQIFDPLSHEYVPGTLEGTIDFVFGPSTVRSIRFQINAPTTGPDVPIGFFDPFDPSDQTRDLRGDLGQFVWTDTNGTDQTQTIIGTGSFNTITGVLTVRASIQNGGSLELRPFSTYIRQATVALRDIDPTDNAADPTGLLYDVAANNFTLFAGQTFPLGLIVEMVNPESVVAIESPLVTARSVSLAGTQVNINAPVRAATRFDVPDAESNIFGTVTELMTVNSIMGSPTFDIRLANDPRTASIRRSQLVVTQTGSLSDLGSVLVRAPETLPFAGEVFVEVVDGNVYLEGRVVAREQSYLVSSPKLDPDATSLVGEYPGFEPYMFTTKSRLTGVDVGVIEATTLAITLGNDTVVLPPVPPVGPFVPSTAFAVLDISTNTAAIRVQASDRVNDPLQQPFPYKLTVRERNDLNIDGLAASSLPIDIFADGSIDLLALLESAGDVKLESTEQFVLGAPITTRFGKIEVTAPTVIVQNSIRVLDSYQDERETDILLSATNGDLMMEDAISGINRVELRQSGEGGISGANRVFADIVEITASGAVDVRTAATRVITRAAGPVSIDELDYGIFEVRDAANVTLIANGFDQIVRGSEAGLTGDTAYTSPALYADVYDTRVLTVSAPRGSVDVFHYGANTLTLGDIALIDGNRAKKMDAAGSVSIRSTLGAIDVYDAPSPTGSAETVRLGSTSLLGGTYRANSPGVVPSRLDRVRLTRTNSAGQVMSSPGVDAKYRFARELDNVDVTTLRLNDRILVRQGAGGSGVGSRANGIYTIIGITYPVGDTSHCFIDLVRSTNYDTTAELAQKHYVRIVEGASLGNTVWTADGSGRIGGVPVYEGWGDKNQYRFANVFDNDVLSVPVQVTPIEARAGFVVAKATATAALLTGAEAAVYDPSTGTITGTGGDFRIPTFNGVDMQVGDLVLVRYGAGNGAGQIDVRSPGLYEVVDLGNRVDAQWTLKRYAGQDDDGDGVLDAFFTGRVAVNEGSLRTAVTGQMFEISLNSLGFSGLRYQQVTEYTGSGTYDSVLQYRADIGSDNPTADVRFLVSTQGGRNTDTGSFGRMLTLVQMNTAINSRTGEPQDQSLSFNPTVSVIGLRQELPPIVKPVTIVANRPVLLDGTDIQTSWDGRVVRSGSVSSNIGPLRSTETKVGRRLYRPGASQSDNQVHGLQVRDGADGSVIGGLSLGGFNNGAAIMVQAASNVLIQDMTLGRTLSGAVLANKIGVELQGPGVENTTIRRSTVLNSSEAGILLGTGTGGVRIVGNAIGIQGQGNKVGIKLASQTADPAYIGAASGLLSAVVSLRGVVESVDAAADTANLRFTVDASSRWLSPGVTLFDTANAIDRRVLAVGYVPAPTDTDQASYRVTVANASRTGGVSGRGALAQGEAVLFQAGAMAESGKDGAITRAGWLTRGDLEIQLPASVNLGDVFLGQQVSSPQGGFASNTVIESIRTTPAGTVLTLSKPIAETTRGVLLLATSTPNLVIGNSDGIVVDSNASRLVNTVVANSVFDGIRVERTDGITAGVHTFGDSQGMTLGPNNVQSFVTSNENLVLYGNQLSGIRFTKQAFAAMGGLTGTNTTPGAADPARTADYGVVDAYLANSMRFRGNSVGFDIVTRREIGNGLTGTENIVIDLAAGDAGHASRNRINFLLLSDTTPLNDNGTPTDPIDDPVSARLLRNESTGLDSQMNSYGSGLLRDQPDVPPDGTGTEPTPPRRPIVRG